MCLACSKVCLACSKDRVACVSCMLQGMLQGGRQAASEAPVEHTRHGAYKAHTLTKSLPLRRLECISNAHSEAAVPSRMLTLRLLCCRIADRTAHQIDMPKRHQSSIQDIHTVGLPTGHQIKLTLPLTQRQKRRRRWRWRWRRRRRHRHRHIHRESE